MGKSNLEFFTLFTPVMNFGHEDQGVPVATEINDGSLSLAAATFFPQLGGRANREGPHAAGDNRQRHLFRKGSHWVNANISDNGGRRKDADRRQFTYTVHIPERRNGKDRRSGKDRRRAKRKENNGFAISM